MVFIQNIHVFNFRSEKNSTFTIPLKSNLLIVFGVAISIILQIIIMETDLFANILKITPIPYSHLIHLFIISLSILLIMEVYKFVKYKKIKTIK